jgi:hypothetical protein
VTDRGREHRRQEDTRRQQAGEREPRPAARRHQEQEARQDSQEVAVADRSAAAVPVVRDDPDVGEPRQGDRDDAEPPHAIARADHEKEPQRDERREEVGEHAAEAAEPEVAEIEQQRLADLARVARRPARGGHLLFVLPRDERPDLVGRHPDAGVVERVARRVEWKAAVEGLALAALVVELTGEGGVERVERAGCEGQHGPAPERFPEPASERGPEPALACRRQQRLEPQRRRHQHVGRLQVARDAEEQCRKERPPGRPRREPGRDEGEAEDLGRRPHEIDRHDGEQAECYRRGERGAGRVATPPQHRERQPQRRRQQEAVGQRQPARSQQQDERRREQRVDERLGVVEPRLLGPHAPQPRESGSAVESDGAARALQEETLRAVRIFGADAREVARVVAQVAIVSEAPGHRVIRRAVAPELAPRGARQVDRERSQAERERQQRECDSCVALAHSHPAARYHAAVRATPSSRPTFGS